MEQPNALDESKLRQGLAKKDFELVDASAPINNGTVEVQANKLYPVSENKKGPLYVPVPVSLKVSLDKDHNIIDIKGGTPPGDVEEDAKHFVKGLIDNNQIEGLSDNSPSNPSHKIELNEKGQQVITRRGFSMY